MTQSGPGAASGDRALSRQKSRSRLFNSPMRRVRRGHAATPYPLFGDILATSVRNQRSPNPNQAHLQGKSVPISVENTGPCVDIHTPYLESFLIERSAQTLAADKPSLGRAADSRAQYTGRQPHGVSESGS